MNNPAHLEIIDSIKDMVAILINNRSSIDLRDDSWFCKSNQSFAPKFEPMPFHTPYKYEMLWDTVILNPFKAGLIVDAGMALPDAMPVCLNKRQMLAIALKTILRHQGYRAYARAKRVRREVGG